jgi:hypothetical protein
MSQLLYNYFGINADAQTTSGVMNTQPQLADQSITVGLGSAGSLLLSPFLALLPFMPVAVPLILLFLSKLPVFVSAPCIYIKPCRLRTAWHEGARKAFKKPFFANNR